MSDLHRYYYFWNKLPCVLYHFFRGVQGDPLVTWRLMGKSGKIYPPNLSISPPPAHHAVQPALVKLLAMAGKAQHNY